MEGIAALGWCSVFFASPFFSDPHRLCAPHPTGVERAYISWRTSSGASGIMRERRPYLGLTGYVMGR